MDRVTFIGELTDLARGAESYSSIALAVHEAMGHGEQDSSLYTPVLRLLEQMLFEHSERIAELAEKLTPAAPSGRGAAQ